MKDKEIIYRALQMWINYIETGDAVTNKSDVLRFAHNDLDIQRVLSRFPRLNESQLSFIEQLKQLQYKILNETERYV